MKSLQDLNPKRIDIIILMNASLLFLIIGLSLPIMTVRKLWESNTYSIISGVQNLWVEKFYVLAVIIFVFSVVFPIAKLITLAIIWFLKLEEERRDKFIHFMEIFGKWSMLDVFITAIIIVWVQLGAMASAKIEIGIYFFAASIILSMIISSMQNAVVKQQ